MTYLFDGPLSPHETGSFTSRLDEEPTVQYDEADWANLPPESWATCTNGAHLEKRRPICENGRWKTIAICAKCNQVVAELEHPGADTSVRPNPLKSHYNPAVQTLRAQIREYLKAHGPSPTREIAVAMGKRPDCIRTACNSRVSGVMKAGEVMGKQRHRVEYLWGIA
jgi:hypothetical protein